MANDDWDVTKPIDHTKIGDVPSAIRDVTSSAKVILSKEHAAPGVDNAGGQHLMGAARVYLQDGLPTLDPEGNALSVDAADTTDNGRLIIDTTENNELRVYVATAAGVETSCKHVRVGVVKASEDINANSHNIVSLASGTQTGQGVHVGQVDTTPLTGQLKVIEPATGAMIAVVALDPPTEDGHLAAKKYVDAHGTVQVVNTQTQAKAYDASTTAIGNDDTKPQNDEGLEVMTCAITPTSATNKLKIEVLVNFGVSGSHRVLALFQDDTADALAASYCNQSANQEQPDSLTYYMAAGTTSETTFKVRAGSEGVKVTVNGEVDDTAKYGGTLISSITITEIEV